MGLTNAKTVATWTEERREEMNYQKIRQNLNEAGRLVDRGEVAEADTLIRTMVGRGLTNNDLRVNLTEAQCKALRNHERAQRKAAS